MRVALRAPGGFEILRAGVHSRSPRMAALRAAALPQRLVLRPFPHISRLLAVVAPLQSKFFPELPVLFAPREEVVGRGGMLYRASGDLAFRAPSRMDAFSAIAHRGSPFGAAKDAPPQRPVVRRIRNLPNLPLLVLVLQEQPRPALAVLVAPLDERLTCAVCMTPLLLRHDATTRGGKWRLERRERERATTSLGASDGSKSQCSFEPESLVAFRACLACLPPPPPERRARRGRRDVTPPRAVTRPVPRLRRRRETRMRGR